MCGNLPAGLSACLRASFKDRPGFEEMTMLGAPPLLETTAGGRPVTNNRYAIDNVHQRQYSTSRKQCLFYIWQTRFWVKNEKV